VSRMKFPSQQVAKSAIFEYLEAFCYTRRLHQLWATGAPPTSRRVESVTLRSRKVNVSVLAGEFHPHVVDLAPLVGGTLEVAADGAL
jgi:hypothetical protein